MSHPRIPLLLLCTLWTHAAHPAPPASKETSPSSAVHSPAQSARPDLLLLAETQLNAPAPIAYQPSRRDPFVDPSVHLTIVPKNLRSAAIPFWAGLEAFTSTLEGWIAQTIKVSGLVYGPEGAMALIGRRILKAGDTLELTLPPPLLKQLVDLNAAEKLGLHAALQKGLLQIQVVRITPSGLLLRTAENSPQLVLPFLRQSFEPTAEKTANSLK